MKIRYVFLSVLLFSVCFSTSCSALSRLWSAADAEPEVRQPIIEPAVAQPAAVTENITTQVSEGIVDSLIIYADGAVYGWENWSWDTSIDFAHTALTMSGSTSIAVTYNQAWAGLYLHFNEQITGNAYDTLRFWVHGGDVGGQSVRINLIDGDNQSLNTNYSVSPIANQWVQIDAPLAALGQPARISGLVWQGASDSAQPTFYIDGVSLIRHDQSVMAAAAPEPAAQAIVASSAAATTGLEIVVDVSADRHVINPEIYGINHQADEELAMLLDLPVRRWGGNHTTRYNWQLDTFNRDNDWFFESTPVKNENLAALPNGSITDLFVEQNQRTGTNSIITVPMIGWTTKDREFHCGFSVAKYGPQQRTDPWKPDCGNGIAENGEPITNNDPTDTSIPTDPAFAQAWIQHLVNRFGTAAEGGVAYYALDNEPMLWNETHRDIHPEPASYDELLARTLAYAPVIKQTDPTAQTLGPVSWGWTAYSYSALDQAEGGQWWDRAPDRSAHGGTPLIPWYLQQMQDYERDTGLRILDYLDIHYYPRTPGVALAPVGNEDTATRRLRSTRSLWDRSYVDESWIDEPVYLLPRMREWVDENYPGTKLALTEYNWGALNHINGALTQADILGIFGRERLDLATLWEPLSADQPFAFAFRMYRNYDGAGSKFGDISVQAVSPEQDRLAVYAAQHSTDGLTTIIVINKTNQPLGATINLRGFTPSSVAQAFRYSPNDLLAIERLPDQTVAETGLQATFSENSITLLAVPSASN